MTKIMLVEDDKSLREIYGVRLLAEGYDIVSAADGEEALAMAIKERPMLIVSDVMMPKISGFDMLDILRSTTETKDIKVIMMTALSSEDQRQRGEQLGADRYLVKSQVGIEDVIRVVHEVLGDQAGAAAPAAPSAPASAPATPPPAAPAPQAPAMNRTAMPAPAPAPRPATPPPTTYTPAPMSSPVPAAAVYTPAPMPSTPVPAPIQQPSPTESPTPPSVKNRVIQPLSDPGTARVDINELLDRELAKEAGIDVDSRPPVASTAQERAVIGNQLNQFSGPAPSPAPSAGDGTIKIDTDGRVSMPGQQPPTPPVPPAPPMPTV
ncbi:MAG TPA: response regulator [Candidatus Saccharimonadales bacterium]|nr:response regulator [Candidatus Saccharimonadales bacterium]